MTVTAIETVTAEEMAQAVGIDPKRYRSELRKEGFDWHAPFQRWTVQKDSAEHRAMSKVLEA